MNVYFSVVYNIQKISIIFKQFHVLLVHKNGNWLRFQSAWFYKIIGKKIINLKYIRCSQ